MTLTGDVMNASIEERELTSKDGVKQRAKISHVLLSIKGEGNSVEVANIRSYDATWSLPELGKKWTSPRVKKYECYDGLVADVSV